MNIHLSEIVLVLLIALLVIKPEQLPILALKVGRIVRWLRQRLMKIKQELEAHD